jgi:hypothetical protein
VQPGAAALPGPALAQNFTVGQHRTPLTSRIAHVTASGGERAGCVVLAADGLELLHMDASGQREGERETAAAPRLTFHPDPSLVQFD